MATYDAATSLYCTLKYKGATGGQWAAESWQTGLRLLARTDGQHPVSAGRVDPDLFSVQDASVTRQTTNFDILQGWSGVTVGGSAITDADVDDILNAIRTWATVMAPLMSTLYVAESIKIYPMLAGTAGTPFRPGISATAPVIAYPRNTGMNGLGPATPPDMALAVSLTSGVRGPSGRGRLFTGGASKNGIDGNGLVSPEYRSAIANGSSALIQSIRNINSGGSAGEFFFTPVIYSRMPNKAGSNADTASVISGVRVGDEYDTQRRRDGQRADTYTQGTVIT